MRFKSSMFIALTAFLFSSSLVLAHVPLTDNDNESLETATIISDPTKSWAIYSELHQASESRYYRLNMEQGQILYVSLFIPIIYYEKGFMPNLIIMGPDITSQGVIPSFIEVSKGANFMVVEGQLPDRPTYEPFGPSSFYRLAEVRLNVPTSGTYYIAVYEPNEGGHFGLAIGNREEFTLKERILTPINMIKVHQWEGQSLVFILAPIIGTLIIGYTLIIVYKFKRVDSLKNAFGWAAASAGLFFLGSGAMLLTQMIVALINTYFSYEAVITLLLFLPSIIFCLIVFRIVFKDDHQVGIKKRVIIFMIGLLSLGVILINSGLVIGSFLAMIASILPTQRKRARSAN